MKVYTRKDINEAINLQCHKSAKMRGLDRLIDRLHDHPKTWQFFENELTHDETRLMAEWYNWKRG